MNKIMKLFFFMCVLSAAQNVRANNIIVSNVGLVGKDTSAGLNNPANFGFVKFDISWENSWRTSSAPNNWDAAWVFLKYRIGTGVWKHATLHTSSSTAPAGSTITPSSDGKGVFLYRSADGSGNVNYSGAKLRWDYSTDGVLDADQVTVKVLAIEMVYVPQGSYYLGTNGSEAGSFTDGSWRSGNSNSFQITSEAALTIDALNSSTLWSVDATTIGPPGTLPANFPKGYNAFYCMKYSISQRQYVDFLNTLTYDQQTSRTAVPPNSILGTPALYLPPDQVSNRNGIKIQAAGISNTTPATYGCDLSGDGIYNQSDDGQYIECNWLSWADGIAYSDWSGLRPMSEMEFEKACRGTDAPVLNDFAWNNAWATEALGIANAGTISETVLPDAANCNFTRNYGFDVGGPVRVGNFARSSSTRQQAGATYYGIMEMSGGVWERAVTVGNSAGRLFTGSHGDGALDANGNAFGVSDWPDTSAAGAGFRGGVWDSPATLLFVSDRTVAAFTSSVRGGNSNVFGTRGFRAVRTAQ